MVKLLSWLSGITNYVIAGLVAAVVGLSVALYISGMSLDAEKTGRKADKVAYELAQEKAKTTALEEKVKTEKAYADKAKKADHDYGALYDKYRTAVLRYDAVKGKAGSVDLPGSPGPSERDNGRDPDTLIPVPRSDLLICAENTARLEQAQKWIDDLKKK